VHISRESIQIQDQEWKSDVHYRWVTAYIDRVTFTNRLASKEDLSYLLFKILNRTYTRIHVIILVTS